MPIIENVTLTNLQKSNSKKGLYKVKDSISYSTISSDKSKDLLYPKDYSPLLSQIFSQKPNIKKPGYGIDIIKSINIDDDNPYSDKDALIYLYDEKLDEYVDKINNFDIDDKKKLLLIGIIVGNNACAKQENIEPQTKKLIEIFNYCLEDIKKLDLNEKNDLKIQKLFELEINNFDNEKCRAIIFDDKYNIIPINVINHIGTFYNANYEIDNFLSFGRVFIELIKDKFSPHNLDNINGILLYEFVNLLHNTNKDSNYKDLSRKDLIFCKTLLSKINTIDDDGSAILVNNMLNKLRPNLSLKYNSTSLFKKEISEKLDIINKLYSKIYSEIPKEQVDALNNILNIEDGLKNVDIESINRLTIENDKTLNYIFNAIPDLKDTIGRKQVRHTYTLDKHIISVAQNVVNNDEYKKLDDNDKKLLLIAALMHDITKKEGGADPQHPLSGAELAYFVLKNVLNEKDRITVANLIYNHHFNALVDNENFINNVAYECASDKNDNFMLMLSILGKADLLGNPLIKDNYLPKLTLNIEKLNVRMKLIKQTLSKMKNQLALTPFPHNITIKNKIQKQKMDNLLKRKILSFYVNPKNNQSIDIIDLAKMLEVKDKNEQKQYFEMLGFGKDTTCDNLNLLIHAIAEPKHVQGIENLINTYKTDAILSTSNITMNNPIVFNGRYCGVILDSDNTNILEISDQDLYSGGQKKRSQIGNFLSCSLTRSDYDLFSIVDRLKTKWSHSEILAADFSINAIFVKKDRYDESNVGKNPLLNALFKFAFKYKLPVILIPEE